MNSFEFIMVLVSIIIGLGIAELLQGVARMMRGRFEGGLRAVRRALCPWSLSSMFSRNPTHAEASFKVFCFSNYDATNYIA